MILLECLAKANTKLLRRNIPSIQNTEYYCPGKSPLKISSLDKNYNTQKGTIYPEWGESRKDSEDSRSK